LSLGLLTDPAAVTAAMREFDALGRTQFLAKYGFGRSRDYMVRAPSGNLYDSKAIVGAAVGFQYADRGPLTADVFSGGEATVQQKLAELGFEVVRIGHDWSREEAERTVHSYFDMLELQSQGRSFSKSEFNEQLRGHLTSRSKASIELKHQNISAVLDEFGLPYIPGYKPRANIQALLRDVVRSEIARRENQLVRIVDALEEVRPPGERRFDAVLIDPPTPKELGNKKRRERIPRKLDFVARDSTNRALGRAGEEWTLAYEKYRLDANGQGFLTEKIEWVSELRGDGAGYDISSFSDGGADRYIEVKTTNGGALTSFIVTANELEYSQEAGDGFYLYRVFEFSTSPHLYMLQGAMESHLQLRAMDYRACLKSANVRL